MSRRNNRDIVMRRLIILFSVITLAAIGFLIFFLSHTISNKESCRDAGIEEFQSGNYERAISSFQRSLAAPVILESPSAPQQRTASTGTRSGIDIASTSIGRRHPARTDTLSSSTEISAPNSRRI